jgi:hypothetical protein
MIKFKIEDKQYVINDFISVGQYSKVYKIKDLFEDELFAAKIINIFTDAPVEDLLKVNYEEVNYLAASIMDMLPKTQPKFVDRFTLDGVDYGFFPKWQELSFGEWVDLDTIATKPESELLDMLHVLAAIMYRPIVKEKNKHDFEIEKYDVNTMPERSELFKNKLDITVLLAAQFFFIKFAKRYSNLIQLSLIPKIGIWKKIVLIWKLRRMFAKTLFKKFTGGTLSQTELLETILKTLSTSSKKVY